MVSNEIEAAKRCCPIFVVAYYIKNGGFTAQDPEHTGCIGSRCNWWRWAEPHRQHENGAGFCGHAYSVRLP